MAVACTLSKRGVLRLAVVAAMVAGAGQGVVEAGLPAAPVEQWRWQGLSRAPEEPLVVSTPLVLQLTDDNFDGTIDERDVPDVAFLHADGLWGRVEAPCGGWLSVLDGASGSLHYSVDVGMGRFPVIYSGGALAGADLDGDGVVELVVTDGSLVKVLRNDGSLSDSLAWRDPVPGCLGGGGHGLGLADMNQDGSVEAYYNLSVLSLDDSFGWSGGWPPDNPHFTSTSHAVDLDPTRPGLELLLGNSLYAWDGTLLWHQSEAPSGSTGVADIDGDGAPEIAVAGFREIVLLEADGSVMGRAPINSVYGANAPLLADLDDDGRAEIVVADNVTLIAFDWTGTELVRLWTAAFSGRPPFAESCCSGLVGHDFDGDGVPEIIGTDDNDWFIVDGRDGSLLHRQSLGSDTGSETPVVADIDGDCSPEILIPSFSLSLPDSNVLIAYDVPGGQSARPLFNQQAYHVTNVNDDGTVPQFEEPVWETRGDWLVQEECAADCLVTVVEVAGPGPYPCDGIALRAEAEAPGSRPADLSWSSSCPETEFVEGASPSEVTVFFGSSCEEDCVVTATLFVGPDACEGRIRLQVHDDLPPSLEPPAEAEVECPPPTSGPGSETAWLAEAAGSDGCGGVSVHHELIARVEGCGSTFLHEYEFWAIDDCGNESPRERRSYRVVDTTPPRFDRGEPIFELALWPPNHRRALFRAEDLASASDACGEVVVTVSGCASNQPENVEGGRSAVEGNGDGETLEDCILALDGAAFATRAERLGGCGKQSARVYSVELTATDDCGNLTRAVGHVRVDHDQSSRSPLHEGRRLGPHEAPPWPSRHPTTYGEGCGG